MLGWLRIALRDIVLMCWLCGGVMICVPACVRVCVCLRACVHWSRPLSDHSSSPSPASGSQLETHPVLQEDHYPHPFIRSLSSVCCAHTHIWCSRSPPPSQRAGPARGPGGDAPSRSNGSLQESTHRMMTVPMPGSWTIWSQLRFNLQIKQMKSHYVEYLQAAQRSCFMAFLKKGRRKKSLRRWGGRCVCCSRQKRARTRDLVLISPWRSHFHCNQACAL